MENDSRRAVRVGTSGYVYEDWKGEFYPQEIKKTEYLEFYAKNFDTVEINSTYYGIPHPRVFKNMAEKTPENFEFVVKANKKMTHEFDEPDAYERFNDAIQPLIERGKYGGVLAQFPWGFKNTGESREKVILLKEKSIQGPLFVEFRNSSWINEESFEFLKKLRIGYCCVDEPEIKGLVPPIARLTSDAGYVRFHSRDTGKWWGAGGGERYNYLYSESELKEWTPKIDELLKQAKKVLVFFNNCHMGFAAKNAKMMKNLLQENIL